MGNRYNQWAPTRYVPLPIDDYRTAALVREQRTQESLNKIENILQNYGSIQAISPDAEALYNQTKEGIRSGTDEITKMDLSTPEAQRRIRMLIQDPNNVRNMDAVYQDAAYAAEARKNLNEYLKKNPAVNAVDYLVAFNKLGSETGDASKFDPSRFRNMPALVDYYDLNKNIAEEVSKLKANEEDTKRIMGDKYITYKQSGVLEDRIRDLAISRVMSDPQAKAQFDRNVKYSFYLANPQDPEEGRQQVADFYRSDLSQRKASLQQQALNLVAGKKEADVKKDKNLMAQLAMGDRMMNHYNQLESLDDDSLIYKSSLDAFAHSFSPYAYQNTTMEEEWTPMAIAQFREAAAWRRMQYKISAQKKTIQDALSAPPLTVPDTRQQQEITPTGYRDYIRKAVPNELSRVLQGMDENGAYRVENFKNAYAQIKGKYYDKGDVFTTVNPEEKAPAGYELVDSKHFGGFNVGGEARTYLRKGAPSYSKKPAEGEFKSLYDNGVQQIKSYLNKVGVGGDLVKNQFNDLKTEADINKAIQTIVNYNKATESTYSTVYTLPASSTKSMRISVADMLPRVQIKDSDGSIVSGTKAGKLQEALRKDANNVSIGFQYYDRDLQSPVYSITYDGETYKIPMHQEYQQLLGPGREVIENVIKGHTGAVDLGDDIMINGLGANGLPVNQVFSGAGRKAYQDEAKKQFNQNVKSLMDAGYTEAAAKQYLVANIQNIADYNRSAASTGGDAYSVVGPSGKKAFIPYATAIQQQNGKQIYYSFNKTAGFVPKSLGEHLYNQMSWFGSAQNPYMVQPLMDDLKNTNLMKILSNFGTGDESPDY